MPIYYIFGGSLFVIPILAATAIVLYALKKDRHFSAGFWWKRSDLLSIPKITR